MDVFTVYSSLALNTNLKWNGKEEKRNTSISLQLLTKGGGSCHAPGSSHTHTSTYLDIHLYNIYGI